MTGIYAPGRPGGWSNFLPHSPSACSEEVLSVAAESLL